MAILTLPQVYLTVLINIISLVVFGGGLFLWRFVYPKKNMNYLFILISFSCIPLISVWRQGTFESGDFNLHVMVLMSFFKSLASGDWIPRWAGDFCGGYGYPLLQYFYHLPYYIASFFHVLLGTSFVSSLKLLVCFSYVGAAITMYFWLKSEFGKLPALLGSTLYLLSPHQLAVTHFVSAIGEGVGAALVPFILWLIKQTFEKNGYSRRLRWCYWLGISVSYSFLILSHHIVPILSLPFVISYFLFKLWMAKKEIRKSYLPNVFFFFGSLVCAFLLTSYHWGPILIEGQLIHQSQMHTLFFQSVSKYFYSPWRFGLLNQGSDGEISWTVGHVQWLMIGIAAASLLIKKIPKADKSWFVFLLGWIVVLFLLLNPLTQPVWLATPILNNFQFAHRLLFLVAIIASALSAIVFKNESILYRACSPSLKRIFKSKKLPSKLGHFQLQILMMIIIGVASMTTILNWSNRGMIDDLDDQKLLALTPPRCDQVALPIWVNPKQFEPLFIQRQKNIEILSGDAEIRELKRTSTEHLYLINANQSTIVRENTTYFSGWVAYLDGHKLPISYQDDNHFGLIQLQIPAGQYRLRFVYENTPVQLFFSKLSIISFIVWLGFTGSYLLIKRFILSSSAS
jgi:hypothetical protein